VPLPDLLGGSAAARRLRRVVEIRRPETAGEVRAAVDVGVAVAAQEAPDQASAVVVVDEHARQGVAGVAVVPESGDERGSDAAPG
jgi:hypothetical protein